MMSFRWFTARRLTAMIAALGLLALPALFPLSSSADPSLGSLHQQLGQQQARQSQLKASLSHLVGLISSLNSQISLVQSREAAVGAQLSRARLQLAATRMQLAHQRHLVALARAKLAKAQRLLASQLVSNYESGTPDLIGAVLESNGFTDLLDKLRFLNAAEHEQQGTIHVAQTAKAQANAAVARLASLEDRQRKMADAAVVEARALAGMNQLLNSKQASLQQAQGIQQAALSTTQAKAGQLQSQISQIEARQAAQRCGRTAPGRRGRGGGGGGPAAGGAVLAILGCLGGSLGRVGDSVRDRPV